MSSFGVRRFIAALDWRETKAAMNRRTPKEDTTEELATMARITPTPLLTGLVVLVAVTALVLIWEATSQPQRSDRSEAFQHLVGGLGLGPSLDLARGEFRFDPRLVDHDASDEGPLPGGNRYTGQRGRSIFHYKSLNRQEQGKPVRD